MLFIFPITLFFTHFSLLYALPSYNRLIGRSRFLLNEVSDVENYISSHPVLSKLNEFELHDADTFVKQRMLSAEDSSGAIDYVVKHDSEVYNLKLTKHKYSNIAGGIPHFVYHPDEDITEEENPYGRKLSDEYSVEYFNMDCLYKSEKTNGVKAILSLCNDETRGVIMEENDSINIQPVSIGKRKLFATFRQSAVDSFEGTCATENGSSLSSVSSVVNGNNNNIAIRQSSSRIDVLVVNDKARVDRYTTFGIFSQTLLTLSLVDDLYSGFPGSNNIEVEATGIVSMAFRDAWNVVRSDNGLGVEIDNQLSVFQTFIRIQRENFLDIFQDTPISFDVAHLLSGEDFFRLDGANEIPGVIGLAKVGAVCQEDNAVGTTQDLFIDTSTATVMAHEIGHNLGFRHTDERTISNDPNSVCEESNIKRIMDAAGSTAQSWSSCSEFWWEETLGGGENCFFSTDGLIAVDEPYCGNGIVEGDEECDCGGADCLLEGQISGQVLDPCCNGQTCRYTGTNECAANDACCDLTTCSFASALTECRPKRDSSDCDEAELCSGDSKDCPADDLAEFGTSCSIDGFGGRCFRGLCVSQGLQCQAAGLGDACPNSGDGDDFCQTIGAAGVSCLQIGGLSCFTDGLSRISPSDGTECDNGRGCYLGSCVLYEDIPLVDSCFNFLQDENETDTDCGGPLCLPCVAGKSCNLNSDCFGTCSNETGLCEGTEIIEEDDIFDVIGRFFEENPGFAAVFYISLVGLVLVLVYRDYRHRKKRSKVRKDLGEVRQQTYRQSLQRTALRPLSTNTAVEALPVEISEVYNASTNSRVSSNPRYSGGTRGRRARPASAQTVESSVIVPIITPGEPDIDDLEASFEIPTAVPKPDNVPEYNDEIEDKI